MTCRLLLTTSHPLAGRYRANVRALSGIVGHHGSEAETTSRAQAIGRMHHVARASHALPLELTPAAGSWRSTRLRRRGACHRRVRYRLH
jgi:hypothetical protein